MNERATRRLLLRGAEFAAEDALAALAPDAAAAQALRAAWQREADARLRVCWRWLLLTAYGGPAVGVVALRVEPGRTPLGWLSYVVAEGQRGRGFAAEAGRCVLGFAFAELGLARVRATCAADNPASLRTLARLGMLPEGRIIEPDPAGAGERVTLIFGLWRTKWERFSAQPPADGGDQQDEHG